MMDWSSFSIGNAAGFIKSPGKTFEEILRSAATDITVGSITVAPREGNPGKTYEYDSEDGSSINALGMPNRGLKETLGFANSMYVQAERAGKHLWWSVAGFSPEEYSELGNALSQFGRIELNFGCPNVWGTDGQKPIVSFNPELMHEILKRCRGASISGGMRVKLSPQSDPSMIPLLAKVIKDHRPFVRTVVTCNTFPNGVAMENFGRKCVLDTPHGYGGVAGDVIHNMALGQVSQFVAELEGSGIDVCGVGGISDGVRLISMRTVGASAIQIGTAFGQSGAKIFSELHAQVLEIETA